MELKLLCGHTQIGYDAIQIGFGYACIGYTFIEVKMDTETGYDNVNIGLNCIGIGYACIRIKYDDVKKDIIGKKEIQVFLIVG